MISLAMYFLYGVDLVGNHFLNNFGSLEIYNICH